MGMCWGGEGLGWVGRGEGEGMEREVGGEKGRGGKEHTNSISLLRCIIIHI